MLCLSERGVSLDGENSQLSAAHPAMDVENVKCYRSAYLQEGEKVKPEF